ncbi:transposase [Morganella morganii]|uniref:Transposase n=1 Tax=Providencia rettgeri TaxID=587 RepID=A0AAW6URZ3_PRORE|nr:MULTISPECIES: transposase [Providencia]MDI9095471.1 transposase [Providencia rettgeri]MDT2038376.1 transposase [Providencia rettgeri]
MEPDFFFKKRDVEKVWCSAVIRLLRESYFQLQPDTLLGFGHIRDYPTWCRYLNAQFQRYWKVHFAKKTRGAWHNEKYLGRYLKQPPIWGQFGERKFLYVKHII